MGATLCDNCSLTSSDQGHMNQVSKTEHFKIIADAINDLPNHGMQKVNLMTIRNESVPTPTVKSN